MATVLSVAERKDRRKGTGSRDQHWYERTYLVKADGPLGVSAVSAAFGLPQPFTVYATSTETDLTARVVSHSVKQLRNTDRLWEVVVRYESVSGSGGEGGIDDKWHKNPLMRPPRMSMEFEENVLPVVGTLKNETVTPDSTDIYEDPVLNAAGQPFVPQPEAEDGTPVIVVERNEAAFNPATAIAYNNTVNSDFFMGSLPRQLKVRITCPGGETAVVDDTEIRYYPVTYRFKGKQEGWDLRLANRGSACTTTGSTVLVPYEDDAGNVVEGWLDSDGAASTSANYIKHRHYREKPFANFNLPNQFI